MKTLSQLLNEVINEAGFTTLPDIDHVQEWIGQQDYEPEEIAAVLDVIREPGVADRILRNRQYAFRKPGSQSQESRLAYELADKLLAAGYQVIWDTMDEEEQMDILLSWFEDPDQAERYLGTPLERLPSGADDNIKKQIQWHPELDEEGVGDILWGVVMAHSSGKN